ncbi:hypothetical protein Lal_00007575 [Lupinus albus]|uniref:Uncharacterized protein n=1 Tax=Lupinus albus TaxID=3870 RepID=A0A6A4P304_LUPAL|nr:hypothetical protein Lalb_Chr16g0382251 [Lupinus albus]KAF1874959.1 hypothetical protein Lal_00007575 [Lupinus albus]
MQTVSDEFTEPSGIFEHGLFAKLGIQDDTKNKEKHEEEEEEEEEEDEEEEFTFMFTNPDGSPISADDAFENGQIRQVFPVFNRDLLLSNSYDSGLQSPIKKVFVHKIDNYPASTVAEGSESGSELAVAVESYCEWTPKTAVKSNSTGLSKLWRFKEHKLRSNSDGKDTLVLFHPPQAKAGKGSSSEVRNVVVKKVKAKTTSSSSVAHEKHYVMYRAKKENEKHKSYLPYKQDLFGFFTNANGFTRNVHPY